MAQDLGSIIFTMSETNRGLVWLRTDLRLTDHEALVTAVDSCEEVVFAYCVDPRHWELNEHGWPKQGWHRYRLIVEALADLRQQIEARGAQLVILQGLPEVEIAAYAMGLGKGCVYAMGLGIYTAFAQAHGIGCVYAHKEVTHEETTVEAALEKSLWALNIRFELYWNHTLFHIEDIPFPIKHLPDIFTQFRKAVEAESKVRPLQPCIKGFSGFAVAERGQMPEPESLGLQAPDTAGPSPDYQMEGGETAALAYLQTYIEQRQLIRTYKETRNGLLGMDYSTKLSAWLSVGAISAKTIYYQIKAHEAAHGANDSTYWVVFELLWRDYFRFVARKFGRKIFSVDGIRPKEGIPHHIDAGTFLAWTEGRTGIPFIDANMRQLQRTGFMSNRGRQNVASFLVNDLGQNWTAGAAWFESHLIDYDPCSNWGNWCYVAGVGNDPRPNRYFNILKQAKDYDPHGRFMRYWLPELANLPIDLVFEPSRTTPAQQAKFGMKLNKDYPYPIVRLERQHQ